MKYIFHRILHLQVKYTKNISNIKTPYSKNEKGKIYYHDISDYLKEDEKIDILKKLKSIGDPGMPLTMIEPNEHGDWVSHRNDVFGTYIPLGNKDEKSAQTFFVPFYSRGLASARDSWCYNSSKLSLQNNIQRTIDFYNHQRVGYAEGKLINPDLKVDKFLNYDSSSISWNRGFKQDLEKGKIISFDIGNIKPALYRPFFKQHLYFSRQLNDMIYQLPKLFPSYNSVNRVITVSGSSVLISDLIPDLHFNGDTQAFPLYYYEERQVQSPGLFDSGREGEFVRRDGVSDFIWGLAKNSYGKNVTKEDIFYFVYGFLHK